MKWSLSIGRLAETDIRAHISLALLVPYVLIQVRPDSILNVLLFIAVLLAIFFCVLLHELGHTLVARRCGYQVQSIVLWPLGGFATMSRQPERPLHELLISAAGPLVNLLLAVPWRWLPSAGCC